MEYGTFQLHERIFAQSIGVDSEEENVVSLTEYASELLTALPDGWTFLVGEKELSGIPIFLNTATDESYWNHPYEDQCKALIEARRSSIWDGKSVGSGTISLDAKSIVSVSDNDNLAKKAETIYAQVLGISATEDFSTQLMALAGDLFRILPKDWEIEMVPTESGTMIPFFFNVATESSQWNHPFEAQHKEVIISKRNELVRAGLEVNRQEEQQRLEEQLRLSRERYEQDLKRAEAELQQRLERAKREEEQRKLREEDEARIVAEARVAAVKAKEEEDRRWAEAIAKETARLEEEARLEMGKMKLEQLRWEQGREVEAKRIAEELATMQEENRKSEELARAKELELEQAREETRKLAEDLARAAEQARLKEGETERQRQLREAQSVEEEKRIQADMQKAAEEEAKRKREEEYKAMLEAEEVEDKKQTEMMRQQKEREDEERKAREEMEEREKVLRREEVKLERERIKEEEEEAQKKRDEDLSQAKSEAEKEGLLREQEEAEERERVRREEEVEVEREKERVRIEEEAKEREREIARVEEEEKERDRMRKEQEEVEERERERVQREEEAAEREREMEKIQKEAEEAEREIERNRKEEEEEEEERSSKPPRKPLSTTVVDLYASYLEDDEAEPMPDLLALKLSPDVTPRVDNESNDLSPGDRQDGSPATKALSPSPSPSSSPSASLSLQKQDSQGTVDAHPGIGLVDPEETNDDLFAGFTVPAFVPPPSPSHAVTIKPNSKPKPKPMDGADAKLNINDIKLTSKQMNMIRGKPAAAKVLGASVSLEEMEEQQQKKKKKVKTLTLMSSKKVETDALGPEETKWHLLGAYRMFEEAKASRKIIKRIVVTSSNGTIEVDSRLNLVEEDSKSVLHATATFSDAAQGNKLAATMPSVDDTPLHILGRMTRAVDAGKVFIIIRRDYKRLQWVVETDSLDVFKIVNRHRCKKGPIAEAERAPSGVLPPVVKMRKPPPGAMPLDAIGTGGRDSMATEGMGMSTKLSFAKYSRAYYEDMPATNTATTGVGLEEDMPGSPSQEKPKPSKNKVDKKQKKKKKNRSATQDPGTSSRGNGVDSPAAPRASSPDDRNPNPNFEDSDANASSPRRVVLNPLKVRRFKREHAAELDERRIHRLGVIKSMLGMSSYSSTRSNSRPNSPGGSHHVDIDLDRAHSS